MRPFRQFLLKLHSRCNLACDYCYVYRHADQSWRTRPRVMSEAVISAAARRIAEHVHAWHLDAVTIVLHGGEPLLAGVGTVRKVTGAVHAAVGPAAKVTFAIQTNGLLLDEAMLDALLDLDIRVGISLDGGRAEHDRHRNFASGAGSFDAVAAALNRLRHDRYRSLYSGLLCTVDVRNDPIDVYESLLAFEPPALDLLLPHGNWTNPPPRRAPGDPGTPYGDWLVTVFDRWYDAPDHRTNIRLFTAIISLLLNRASGYEAAGLDPVDYITVETDGSLEQSDVLKTVAEGAAATGLSVFRNSFDEALQHPGVQARQQGLAALSADCRACRIVRVCGGGHYAHRFRAPDDFANPTVYCPDQKRLIGHIRERVSADLRRAAERPPTAPARSPA
uniref:FxsB family cyclophane-forming radical SAM/SPASM peptide maturase n=1 Tax=Paractinoplanes polyasparticus TaxID=2856853 RepID=UPI001C861907|nr:FxsB family cyclophane-forming radical SAM/SPASM peptide maturase [Actinoplanes polyasparticus]